MKQFGFNPFTPRSDQHINSPYDFHQGPANIRPGHPGQVEKFTGQVFHSLKKPAGPLHLTKKVILHNTLEGI